MLRYEDRAFLLTQNRVYAMMVTARGARTTRGIRIGDALAAVGEAYGESSCYRVSTNEGRDGYRVCRVKIGPKRFLSFGGDPIRSFTLFSRERREQ